MTKEEVLEILPNPRQSFVRRTKREGLLEGLVYEGTKAAANVRLVEGKVVGVTVRTGCDFTEDIKIFAAIFQFLYVRLAIFFGCVFVFLNLFRGEMLDKSLHYYFLAPVRREIVVLGKYLAGLVATVVVFTGSAIVQLWIYYRHFDGPVLEEYLAQGKGWQHAAAYVGVAALACLGYGSVFLTAGIIIRNPLIPAAVMLFWEGLNGLLPLALRRLSIIYYLKSLCPVEIPLGKDVPPPLALLALNVEAAPPATAIAGLVAMAAALLMLAAWRARTLEIQYAAD